MEKGKIEHDVRAISVINQRCEILSKNWRKFIIITYTIGIFSWNFDYGHGFFGSTNLDLWENSYQKYIFNQVHIIPAYVIEKLLSYKGYFSEFFNHSYSLQQTAKSEGLILELNWLNSPRVT